MSGTFEPRIIGFLCNWCAYAGADKAGSMQKPFASHMHAIRVMCSGRVEPEFVIDSFKQGADGVIIMACHPGDCHYKEGNYKAAQRHRLLLRLMEELGIEKERCVMRFVSASEGDKYIEYVEEAVDTLRGLGPLVLDVI
ncbi:hydrogenase iron-sulfur subunit [Nitrospirota bacterium]